MLLFFFLMFKNVYLVLYMVMLIKICAHTADMYVCMYVYLPYRDGGLFELHSRVLGKAPQTGTAANKMSKIELLYRAKFELPPTATRPPSS